MHGRCSSRLGQPDHRRSGSHTWRVRRVAFLSLLLGACGVSPTSPPVVEPPAARRAVYCVAPGAQGQPPTVIPADSEGNCPAGFDIHIWM